VNFCLRESDTALSVASRSKVLNAVTNNVFRSLIIGNERLVKDTMQLFEAYRDMVDETPCDLSGELTSANTLDLERACVQDQLTARLYMDALFDVLSTGTTRDMVFGGIYDRGYKRLLTTLRDAGCKFLEDGRRPVPKDVNICLSLLDLSTGDYLRPSKTKTLNELSNCVSRAILYGSRAEQRRLATIIEDSLPRMILDWNNETVPITSTSSVDMATGPGGQEAVYTRALVLYLREGLSAAQQAVALPGGSNSQTPEEDFRWVVDESRELTGMFPPLRLYDVYLNAFYRVVELCLNELSVMGSSSPLNDNAMMEFVQWEQSVRRNLTEKVWDPNPAELSGSWELIDIAARGNLEAMLATPSIDNNMYGVGKGVTINLRSDGSVVVGADSALASADATTAPAPSNVSSDSARWFYR